LVLSAISKIDLDFDAIVAGLNHYNESIKSGEADITHKRSQYNMQDELGDSIVTESHLTFDGKKTLFEIEKRKSYRSLCLPKETYLIKKANEFRVEYDDNGNPHFSFISNFFNGFIADIDPRHLTRGIWNMGTPLIEGTWPADTFAKYIVKKRFRITSKEAVDGTMCYVLEAKDGQKHEKIWIAPECGFGYLKYEKWSPCNDIPDIGIRKGTPGGYRCQISYQQNNGTWFPKKELSESFWIDSKGKEHPILRKELEVKNLRLNCRIPPKTFTIEIPDNASIRLADSNEYISKQELLKRYPVFIEE